MKLYQVNAMIVDSDEASGFRSIWQFNSIEAYSKKNAIDKCKEIMLGILGHHIPPVFRHLKWKAKYEWEDDLRVN